VEIGRLCWSTTITYVSFLLCTINEVVAFLRHLVAVSWAAHVFESCPRRSKKKGRNRNRILSSSWLFSLVPKNGVASIDDEAGNFPCVSAADEAREREGKGKKGIQPTGNEQRQARYMSFLFSLLLSFMTEKKTTSPCRHLDRIICKPGLAPI